MPSVQSVVKIPVISAVIASFMFSRGNEIVLVGELFYLERLA